MKRFYFSIGCIALWCLALGSSLIMAQTTNNSAGINSPFTEPLKITRVSFKSDNKKPTGKAGGNENWLDDLSVEIENASGKTIKFAQVEIGFSGAKAPKNFTSLTLQYGGLKTGKAAAAGESLRPGEKAKLAVSRQDCSGTQTALIKNGYVPSSAGEITARLGKVIFEDGNAWSEGKSFYPDPKNSNRWLIAESDATKTILSRKLFGTTAGASFLPVSLSSPAQTSNCGKYTGFEILYDCCPQTLVFSDTVDYEQRGNATLEPVVDECPYTGTPSCVFYRVIPCA